MPARRGQVSDLPCFIALMVVESKGIRGREMSGANVVAGRNLVDGSQGGLETRPYGLDGVSLDVGPKCRHVGAGL